MVEIKDTYIEEAERILLPAGMHFDEERRDFIKCMDSCDLLAVPGSGKTTALQAKIYCLCRTLDFSKGKGLLVLSHTNAAVNEIRSKLKGQGTNLFEAPNFVGTVQDFVDTFLTIPFYEHYYKRKVATIDTAIYEKEVDLYMSIHIPKNAVFFLAKKNYNFKGITYFCRNSKLEIAISPNGYSLKLPDVQRWIKEGTCEAKLEELKAYVDGMKKELLERGVLSYEDCYALGNYYLDLYPHMANILRKRFPYVFVDETQDLENYQIKILDRIFNDETIVLERIGDNNQSIYVSPEDADKTFWNTRNELYLKKSFRLSPSIAKIVNPFTLFPRLDETGSPKFEVVGVRTDITIAPRLVLFDPNNKNKLIPHFNDLIEYFHLRDKREGKKYGFHIIGWNTTGSTSKRLRLSDIFPNQLSKIKEGEKLYENLNEFIQLSCKEANMKEANAVVERIILSILRIVEYKDEKGRYFNTYSLRKYENNLPQDRKHEIELIQLHAAVHIYHQNYFEAYNLISDYLPRILHAIGKDSAIAKMRNFIGEYSLLKNKVDEKIPKDIFVSSVHAVKGQTHCATMYVETSYYKYETEFLLKVKMKGTKKRPTEYYHNPLLGDYADDTLSTRAKAAIKMMYVGFSRPTHLLCFASFKNNWTQDNIDTMKSLGWEVDDLTE